MPTAVAAVETIEAVLGKPEPLHPDLVPYIERSPFGGKMIRHPIIYELFYVSPLNALVNRRYEQKQRQIAEALAQGDVESLVLLHERPHRLLAFELHKHLVDDEQYWSLLSWVWMDSENIWQNYREWVKLWSDPRPGWPMTPDERTALHALPDRLTVYRGTTKRRRAGLSWTLNRDKAVWFARRFSPAAPVVIQGTVPKSRVLAYYQQRHEDEIVVLPKFVVDRRIDDV